MSRAISSALPRATWVVAAAAVLSLVSGGTWGSWQGTGARNGSLAVAQFGYSLSGSHVTGGGTGYSWSFLLGLGTADDQFSVTNTGSVIETISGTITVTGLNLGANVTVYGCTNTFTNTTCTGRATLGTVSNNTPTVVTLAPNLAAGATYNISVGVPSLVGVNITVAMPANSMVTAVRSGINRTTG
jgi:hypothetical protein